MSLFKGLMAARHDAPVHGGAQQSGSIGGLLKQSPSFNDFSVGCGNDFSFTGLSNAESHENLHRLSTDSTFSNASTASSLESSHSLPLDPRLFVTEAQDELPWSGRAPASHGGGMGSFASKTASMPIPHAQLAYENHKPVAHTMPGAGRPPPSRQPSSSLLGNKAKRKEGKIDGLDYYSFCELIRSSSL